MAHILPVNVLAACIALAAGSTLSAQPLVRLHYATFDPAVGEPAVPEALRSGKECGVWLVQFASSPTEADRQAVRKQGGEVVRFATDHTHVVRASASAIGSIRTLPRVRWVGAYHPAYRLESSVVAAIIAGAPEHGGARYSIEAFDGGSMLRIKAAVVAAGGLVEVVEAGTRLEATLTRAQLLSVARLDDVNFIDPVGAPGADMDIVRQLVGAVPVLSSAGFTGQGVRAEVFDTGLDITHPAFQNPAPLLHAPINGDQTHGSAVYGIVFGNGAGNAAATGMLPDREQGIFCPYTIASTFGGPTSNRDLIAQLVAPAGPYRAVFQTRAVGSVQGSSYTTISAIMDAATFEYDFLICQSMGDTGNMNSRPEGWAKNLMSCGGLTHANTLARNDDTAGPNIQAADGRYKPDMIAPRDSITAAAPGGLYTQFGGISASTGIVAGCFGLATQMWHEGVWPGFGGGASVFADRPHISTIRALVINSAYQYDWTGGGPNILRGSQGWGVPDLAGMYAIRGRTLIINETDPVVPQQVRTYTVLVPPGEPALKATMVYLDPQGNPAAAHARINDLTLRVTSPSQVQYWGNFGLRSGIWSQPGGTANTVDVVENVFIQNPAAGNWTVEVIASEIVQDARVESPALDADFALVVTGVSCYANCDGSTAPPVLNANDFTCFLNKFAAGDPYANCDGNMPLTANDFVCYLNRYAEPCPSQ
jgi:serine protease AprX